MKVIIYSFGYKDGGPFLLPDHINRLNGGGLIFDLRCIEPPIIKADVNGNDDSVKKYLETNTLMPDYLKSVKNILCITIDAYLHNGESSMTIGFGCISGRHRSVYATEKIANWIISKYPNINIQISHTNKDNWN
jgi:RNase adaptor protein for sRNA GlmZ degradation